MYNKLISKNLSHFGLDGLIMYSKYCDYYHINPVTMEDIKMFYDLLRSKEPLPNNVRRLPHLSCCLYFLAKNDQTYLKTFTEELIFKLSRKDEINDTNLFLIYNIIEFDQRYLHSKGNKLKFLLEYLERYSAHKKTVENFLLFKYYRGLIKYLLGEIKQAYQEYLELIIGYEDYVKQKTKYNEFIRLKNDLFKVQLDLTKHIKEDYFEQYCFMKDLFDRVKNENKILGIKLGFCLFEILCRQNKFNECIPLLKEMKKILKTETLSGVQLKISIDYYLAIISRMGFIGVLIGDRKSVEEAVKKLKKILDIIEKDRKDKKLSAIFNTYSFIISILNVNLGNFENRIKEKEAIVKAQFFSNNMELNGQSYLVNNYNKNDLIIDLYCVNNMDMALSTYVNSFMKKLESSINIDASKVLSNSFLTFLAGKHDRINKLSESYCTDYNKQKRNDYIQKINWEWKVVMNYVKKIFELEPLIETDFAKSIIINITCACAQANIYSNNKETLKLVIKTFDDLSKLLGIKEGTTSFELYNKIKGDYWFKDGDYNAAINYYKKAVVKMKGNDPKKPVVYFNIGCMYYLKNEKHNAIEFLNQCINAFRVFEYEKKTFNVLIRPEIIKKKVDIAKFLLNNIGVSNN